ERRDHCVRIVASALHRCLGSLGRTTLPLAHLPCVLIDWSAQSLALASACGHASGRAPSHAQDHAKTSPVRLDKWRRTQRYLLTRWSFNRRLAQPRAEPAVTAVERAVRHSHQRLKEEPDMGEPSHEVTTTREEEATGAAAMFANDRASQHLGITVDDHGPGWAQCSMTVTEIMTNGHDITHGGYVFLFADTTFAMACNYPGSIT